MRCTHLLLLALTACLPLAASVAELRTAVGTDHWPSAGVIHFTWTHHPSETARTYAWDLGAGTVTASLDGERVTIPAGRMPDDEAERTLHHHFINDSYWMAFEHVSSWDGSTREVLEPAPIPGRDGGEPHQRIAVSYPERGGYTPGDRYVLFLGPDDRSLAWSYHPGGAEESKITTTRDAWQQLGTTGTWVPTRFVRIDGTPFVTVSQLRYEAP